MKRYGNKDYIGFPTAKSYVFESSIKIYTGYPSKIIELAY